MKTKNLSALLVSTLLFASTSVYAEPYMVGQLGAYRLGNQYFRNLWEKSNPHMTGRIGLGYAWDINHDLKLGIETGWHYYQSYKGTGHNTSFEFKKQSFDLLGVLDFRFENKINVFAKAGLTLTNDDLKAKAFLTTLTYSDHVLVPKIALGIGYDLSSNINANIALSHEFYTQDDDFLSDFKPTATALMLGVNYRFL